MPSYSTPNPIDLAISLQVGRIEVVASDRADTVVTVSPSSATREVDQRGVEQTKVALEGQRLTIVGPKPRISWIGPGPADSVDVKVELPSDSRLTAEIAVGNLRTAGRLGATRIKASTGTVDVDGTGDLWVRASHGTVTVAAADGEVEITSDYGQIRVGTIVGQSCHTATSRSPRPAVRLQQRRRTATSSCARSRAGPSRSRAVSARSRSA